MLTPYKDLTGNVRLTLGDRVLLVTKQEYEQFIRGVFAGEYDYSLLKIED